MLAFRNPDDATVILIVNTADHTETKTIALHGKVYKVKMKPNSFNTLVIK